MTFAIRAAVPADAEVIARQRLDMFHAMGYRDEAALLAMRASFLPWVSRRLDSGEYLAWFAIDDRGVAIAGAGVWFMDWPPHMVGPGAPRANVLNVWVEPEWRRRGIARRLMDTVLDACRERGIRAVVLHASPDGRPLYESLGFSSTNEMRLML